MPQRHTLLDILEHANPDRYGGQRIFVVRREWKSAKGGKRERTRYSRYAKATHKYAAGRLREI